MIKVMTPEFERALMLAWGHAAECDKELYWKVSARDDIVEALIVVGRKSEAIEILHQQLALLGPVPSPRYTAPLRKLASGFARAGDFDHALTVARGLSPLSEQVASLAKIASVMINNGFAAKGRDTFAIARNLVATGTDSWFGGQVDILLSDSLAERLQTIRYRQNHTLRDIAYYQTDCGLFPEAEETARLIENTHPFDYRSAILARVVLTEIRQILKDR